MFFLLPVVLVIHLDCFGASHRVLEISNIEMSALTLCSDIMYVDNSDCGAQSFQKYICKINSNVPFLKL